MKKRLLNGWLVMPATLLAVCSLLVWTAAAATNTDGIEETVQTSSQSSKAEKPLTELRDELLAILGDAEGKDELKVRIDQLIALGDPGGTLRSYLEDSIKLHQLRYEAEQLEASIERMAASDGSIEALNKAVESAENPDEILARIGSEVSEQAARLLESAGYEPEGELVPIAEKALEIIDGELCGEDSADAAAIVVFNGLLDSGLLDEVGAVTATDAITAHFAGIAGRYNAMDDETRQQLLAASQDIAGRANGAEAFDPAKIVVAGDTLELTNPLFTYKSTVMISLDDAAAFMEGDVVEMEENSTVVIQTSDVVLEMSKGSGNAYQNDKLKKMPQPVISFDGVCYLPLDTVLGCCNMQRLDNGEYILLYKAAGS